MKWPKWGYQGRKSKSLNTKPLTYRFTAGKIWIWVGIVLNAINNSSIAKHIFTSRVAAWAGDKKTRYRKLSSFPDNLLRPPKPPNLLFFSNFNNLSNFMQSLRLVIVERSFACIFFWFIENTFWGGPHEYFLFLFWCFYSWGNRLLTPMNPIHSTTFKVASWNILKKRKVEDILIENSRKEMKRVTISSLQENIIW